MTNGSWCPPGSCLTKQCFLTPLSYSPLSQQLQHLFPRNPAGSLSQCHPQQMACVVLPLHPGAVSLHPVRVRAPQLSLPPGWAPSFFTSSHAVGKQSSAFVPRLRLGQLLSLLGVLPAPRPGPFSQAHSFPPFHAPSPPLLQCLHTADRCCRWELPVTSGTADWPIQESPLAPRSDLSSHSGVPPFPIVTTRILPLVHASG